MLYLKNIRVGDVSIDDNERSGRQDVVHDRLCEYQRFLFPVDKGLKRFLYLPAWKDSSCIDKIGGVPMSGGVIKVQGRTFRYHSNNDVTEDLASRSFAGIYKLCGNEKGMPRSE